MVDIPLAWDNIYVHNNTRRSKTEANEREKSMIPIPFTASFLSFPFAYPSILLLEASFAAALSGYIAIWYRY